MSPAQSSGHQSVSSSLFGALFIHLKGLECSLFSAPFDVRFVDEDGVIRDTVQPDISVICDLSKIDRRGCLGAPDLVVEILSPSSSHRDLTFKYDLYKKHGVEEYWVAHPEEKTLLIYTLDANQEYIPSRLYTRGDTVASGVLEGFELNLDEVFDPFDWAKVEEEEATYNRM